MSRFRDWLPWKTPPPLQLRADVTQPPTHSLVVDALVRQGLDRSRQRLDRERFGIYARGTRRDGIVAADTSGGGVPAPAEPGFRAEPGGADGAGPARGRPCPAAGRNGAVAAVHGAESRAGAAGGRAAGSGSCPAWETGRWRSASRRCPRTGRLTGRPLEWLSTWAGPRDYRWACLSIPSGCGRFSVAYRTCGAGLRIEEPRRWDDPVIAVWPGRRERIRDPQLAAWLYGAAGFEESRLVVLALCPVRPAAAPVSRVVPAHAQRHHRS